MTRDQATAFVTRYARAFNQHDVESLTALYDEDAVVVSPMFGELCGRQSIEGSFHRLFAAVPDAVNDMSADDVIVDRARVVAFFNVEGTMVPVNRTQFTDTVRSVGVIPSGARVAVRSGVIVFTLRDHGIVHEHRMWDAHALHQVLEKLSLDRELKAAAEVQRALLPRQGVVRDYCDVAGASIACRTIGGDFFEYIDLPSGDIGIALCDVSGKGPPAALLTSLLQGILAVEAESGRGPAATLSRINRTLIKRAVEPRFATFFFGVLSRNGTFTYANAGHNPPILRSCRGDRALTAGGTILGVFADVTFDEERITLQPQDVVVCFTDGVTEAINSSSEEFGEERLLSCLNRCHKESSADTIERVFANIREFGADTAQSDDITMLVLRFLPIAAHSVALVGL